MDKDETMNHNSFKATLNDNVKFIKNAILFGIRSNFLDNITTSSTNYKNGDILLNFREI